MAHGIHGADRQMRPEADDGYAHHVYMPAIPDTEKDRLTSVHIREARFRDLPPFDPDSTLENCRAFCLATTGRRPAEDRLKADLIDALNQVQVSPIPYLDNKILVSFADSADLWRCLEREGIASPETAAMPIRDPSVRKRIVTGIGDALDFIRAVDEPLHRLIVDTVGTIVCLDRQGQSGSVSSLMGLFWLSPKDDWRVLDYAENIVHEYIHNAISIADMTRKIFSHPHHGNRTESMVLTAILENPRNYNIAFHSLYVSMGLKLFMRQANQPTRARQIIAGAGLTAREILRKSEHLTDYGKTWLRLLASGDLELSPS